MTPFNIPKKQVYLTKWLPRNKKRKLLKKLTNNLCKECRYGSSPSYVNWNKIEEGNHFRKRCAKCMQCLAKNCCKQCGYEYGLHEPFFVSEYRCGYCHYLDKYYDIDESDDNDSVSSYNSLKDQSLQEYMREYSRTLHEACTMPKLVSAH